MRDDDDLEQHGGTVVWCKMLDIFFKVETRRHADGIDKRYGEKKK